MKRNIYVLGNPLVPQDCLPVKLIPYLRKKIPEFKFIHLDPTEEIELDESGELILLDTVIGIKKVKKFNGLNHWILSPRISLHDYDLPLQLGLLTKLKKISKVIIIGIPENGKLENIIREVSFIIHNSFLNPAEFKKMRSTTHTRIKGTNNFLYFTFYRLFTIQIINIFLQISSNCFLYYDLISICGDNNLT